MAMNLKSPATRAAAALGVVGLGAAFAAIVFPDQAYLWVKAVHVVAIISWMAGMLYLPRLFVYHCDASTGSEQSETFKVMEQRLLRIIMTPAMAVTWISGLWLAWETSAWTNGWFHVKFLAVVLMTAAHGHFSASLRKFAADKNERSSRFWRYANEVPTVLMIIIVVMVIVRPF